MSSQFLFSNAFILLLLFMFLNLSKSDYSDLPSPSLAFHLEYFHNVFKTSDIVAIDVVVLKDFKSDKDRLAFNPNVSMNGVMGNSSLITGLWIDENKLKIYFMPIMIGLFDVVITDTRFNIRDATIRYYCTPGPIYEPGGIVSWMGHNGNEIVAGTKATVLILPKDAFGNTVTSVTEKENIYNFEVYATNINGSGMNLMDISNKGWDELGYIRIEFVAITAGHLLIHVKHKNDSLIDSPLPLTVHPGELDVANCVAHWITDTKSFQLFSTMEIFINQRDKFHNLVPGMYEFDIEVIEKGTKLSLPIGDLRCKEVSPGIQSSSFTLTKPGDFILIVSDKKKIMNTSYEFSTYIGYCDGERSIVNGSGLFDSVAGEVSRFSMSLKDAYQYPSLVQLERLQAQITLPSLSLHVNPQIQPKDNVNGTQSTGIFSYGAYGPTGLTHVPSVFAHDNSFENPKKIGSDFEVVYVPKKSGIYEIRIFCGNIPLNGGHPFTKEVSPAEVNTSVSGVRQYDGKASAGHPSFITVELLDSFHNRVLHQKSRLELYAASLHTSPYVPCWFEDNDDGTYNGRYIPFGPGKYELCVSYSGKRLSPCPFGVQVLRNDEYPTVRGDTVTVWEDQSTAFNVLDNDFFSGAEAKIVELKRPSHGSLLQSGTLFRYTPYKGFYGDDKFAYTLLDVKTGHTGSAVVDIYVLTIPPQFVSPPKQLQVVEDTFSPRFGGFPSIEIIYSDPLENISITLTAQNGSVFLSPYLMQLWDSKWNEFSVERKADDCLQLTGRMEVINFALKLLQYSGKANFSGNDIIKITTFSKNGEGYLDVPINIAPVNDPPVINAPKFIILEEDEKENKGFLIFNKQRDKFDFSIVDPDLLHFPGNQSDFRVMFSAEVTSGTFSAKLPAHLISTTELKLRGSKLWQPLQTFVEISKHFTVNKVKGIRFLGTIHECNTLLHHLFYYGDKHDGVLQLRVNDMGWYGCYPDCWEMMSVPLVSEATVHLIARTPMNSLVAHSLGSVIVIESVVVAILALVLMLFMCKCATVLVREKKKQQLQSLDFQLNQQMQSTGSPENTGDPLGSFRESEQPSNLPKPVEEPIIAEAAEEEMR